MVDLNPYHTGLTWRNGRTGTEGVSKRLDRFLVSLQLIPIILGYIPSKSLIITMCVLSGACLPPVTTTLLSSIGLGSWNKGFLILSTLLGMPSYIVHLIL